MQSIKNKPLKQYVKVVIIILVILALAGIAHAINIKNDNETTTIVLPTKNMSYHTNIIKDTAENENYRKVLFTGTNSQLVIMSVPPGQDVGKEVHKYTEQTLFFLSGSGIGELDGQTFPVGPGDVVVVVPGTEHDFTNTGTTDMKIYTVYAPKNHIDGRIQATKADADADTADEAIGENPPVK